MKLKDVFTKFVSKSERFKIKKEVKARLVQETEVIEDGILITKCQHDIYVAIYLLCKFISENNIRIYRRKVGQYSYEYSTESFGDKCVVIPLVEFLIPALNDKRSAKSLLFAIHASMASLPTHQVKVIRNLLQTSDSHQISEVK